MFQNRQKCVAKQMFKKWFGLGNVLNISQFISEGKPVVEY